MMDLGATRCRPVPRCGECPAAPTCRWHRAGHPEPDPAIGSAGVSSAQAPYEGSERQARGAVLRALVDGARPLGELPEHVVDGLVRDGLAERAGGEVRLPS